MNCNKKRKIAVITTNMDVEYAAEIQRGIMGEAQAYCYDVYIFNAYVSSDETLKHNMGQYNIYTLANLSQFDGVIVFSNLIQGRMIYDMIEKRLEGIDIPVVGIDAPIGKHYCVGVENYQSMKNIVEHFIVHHNFTRINYISGQSFNTDSQMRLKAYCDALQEHGIPVEEARIFPGTFTSRHGREVAYEMLASGGELPQAVVCGNDGIALGFCSVLRERGIKIPEQIAVSGFDNTFEARNSVPRLTSVDRALENIGKEAVRKLKRCFEGKHPAENEVFPAVPVFAGSCGCEREEDGEINSIRQRYLQVVDHYEKHLTECNIMIEDLNDCKSFEDFLTRLKNYVEVLKCDRFYFCLDSELVEDLKQSDICDANRKFKKNLRTVGYAKEMAVPLAFESNKFVEYEAFPSKRMLPWQCEEADGCHVFVFFPVHFQDYCQGYVVIENSEYALNSPLFRTWLINLSNGLENLRKQADLKYTLGRLDRLYVMDYLTDLYNRYGFSRYTAENFQKCVREQRTLMILFADLDGLKKINDMYGHDKGDIAIKMIADALREACVRDEVCARFGGDEYVVYAADYDEEKAEDFCRRFDKALLHYKDVFKLPFTVSASLGYEVFVPSPEDSIDQYIERADQKMYNRKNNNRLLIDNVRIFS